MTYKEIWTRLNNIHTEFMGEITAEAIEAAWSRGQANPCGCSICNLLEAITIAEVTAAGDDDVDYELEFSHWVDWDVAPPSQPGS